jgi:hypothetical protein
VSDSERLENSAWQTRCARGRIQSMARDAPMGDASRGAPSRRQSIEPLYTLAVAAELIPFPSTTALSQFLFRHKNKFEARYRRTRWYEVRLLTESDILRIREMTLLPKSESRYGKRVQGTGPIGAIMRRAMNIA